MKTKRLGIVVTDTEEIYLRVPPGTTITGFSPHFLFVQNLYAFRVEHPDLREIPEAGTIPYVRPIWIGDRFVKWEEHGL